MFRGVKNTLDPCLRSPAADAADAAPPPPPPRDCGRSICSQCTTWGTAACSSQSVRPHGHFRDKSRRLDLQHI
jgi:hypothetical protein